MDVDPSPAQQRSSRKHLRSSDDDDDLEWSSDVSGQFDDAEEPDVDDYKSPSAKSAKRRRSNDWPLPEEAADYGNNGTRNGRNANGSLGPNYKASPRSSPRGSAASLRNRHKSATNSPRHRLGRQSRFVEATMSDSVSEQPPSHLFPQREREQKAANAGNRGSGIFRFGKAIASAFNPFGSWSKSSPENATKSPQKDALTQAEEAYAQLKMAGYKGTNKGAYMQNQHIEPSTADQTWQAIQDKMRYGTPVESPPRQAEPMSPLRSAFSPLRSPSKSSKRSSFQDLRRVTSFGIPFVRHSEQPPSDTSVCLDHPSEDSENNGGIRRQKSRKELSRESKLVRKVSNLEDKLDRARRELRHLSGNEERLPALAPEPRTMSLEMDPGSYPRKFVPGALPTLPSERLLDQQAAMSQSPEPAAQITALPSMTSRSISPEESQGVSKSPKRRSKESRPSSMGKESSSRKRKSTVPEPIDSRKPPQSTPKDCINNNDHPSEHQHLVDAGLLSPPRQSKWQKFEPGDSPGSVERKRTADRGASMAALNGGSMHKRSPVLQSQISSPSVHRSPNSKNIRSSPLRMQRGHSAPRSTRSTSSTYTTTPILKSDPILFDFSSPPPPSSEAHRTFYLQPHCRLDPDHSARNSPTKSRLRSRRRHSYDVDIPPVPPLPKELISSAAKVTKPSSKTHNPARGSAPAVLSQQALPVLNEQPSLMEGFPWPEDIF
ncbi:hypothetical protein N7478_009412 [Penicillium angulare]|uniref:uncharacterized protein n=1 Tax=Penicillium angulare TaxID=116970 RepID=UPI0025423DAE|nr:uncharacterized protein N7478_009412 [Penicillium angulare]KAJ5266604.1 hypothetical protein N7478_009412 [Penicillium angulare]